MVQLSEKELKKLIQGGETNTVELKVAAPRATEMAERLCGMANAQGGMVIIGVKDALHEIVGVPDHRIGETLDVILRAVRQMIKPELVLDPPEPEIYTVSGKKLVVATVKPSHGPVYQAHGIYWVRRGRGLPIVGTESRNRNLAQKGHGTLEKPLEKLFRQGGGLSKRAMV